MENKINNKIDYFGDKKRKEKKEKKEKKEREKRNDLHI